MVVQRQCNACGILIQKSSQAQSPECGACGLVCYCSTECQKADWNKERGGHKQSCKRLPLEKPMVQELLELEVEFLHGLSNKKKKLLMGPAQYKERKGIFPIQHYSMSLQIALVLAHVHPCCVVHEYTWPQYASSFYEKVARPWFEKHKAYLVEHNFELRMLPPDAVPHVGRPYKEPLGTYTYGNGVIFADGNSDEAALVNRVFNRVGNEVSTYKELFTCFGCWPGFCPDGCNPDHVSHTLYKIREPKLEILFKVPKDKICCAPILNYQAPDRNAVTAGEHFLKCQLALNRMGFAISFDLYDHDDLREEEFAKALLAAGGGDYETTKYFLVKRPLFLVGGDQGRVTRILDIMSAQNDG